MTSVFHTVQTAGTSSIQQSEPTYINGKTYIPDTQELQNLISPSATCSWINILVDPGTTLQSTNQI